MTVSLRTRALTGARWNTLSVIFCATCQLLQTVILARLLDPKDFGLMAMVMVVVGFSNVFADMGISNGIICRQNTTPQELSSLYWLTLFSGLIPFGGVMLAAPLVADFYHEPELLGFLHWGALTFLITPFGQQFQILLQKNLVFRTLARVEMFSTFCGFLLSVIFAYFGHGVYSLIWGQLIVTTSRAAHYTFIGWQKWRPRLYFRAKDVKSYLSFGLFQMGERGMRYLGWQLDKILIGSLLGAQALGYYNIAYQLVLRPYQVFNPLLTKVAFPTFAIMQNDDLRLKNSYLKLISIIALFLMPLYTLMIVAARPFFQTFFGPNWEAAIPVFQILSILGFFYSLGNPISSLMLAKGRADLGFYQNMFVFLVYGLAVFLGSRFGLTGVAWGLVTATAGLLFPFGFLIRWLLIRMTPRDFLWAFGPFLLASWVSGALVTLLRLQIPAIKSGALTLGIIIPEFALIYFAIIFSLKRSFLAEVFMMVRMTKE